MKTTERMFGLSTTMSMMANLQVREVGGDLVERLRPGEAGHDDRIAAVLGEAAQRLLALRGVGDFELDIFDAGLGLEFFRAVEGRFVERFVELSAEIVEQRRLDVGREGRKAQSGGGQKAKNDTFHVIHTLSVCFLDWMPRACPDCPAPRGTWQGLSPSAHGPILHGQKQNSRGILTFRKTMRQAARRPAKTRSAAGGRGGCAGMAQATPVPFRPQ